MATSTIPINTSGVKSLDTKFGGATVKYIKQNGVVSVYLANRQLSGMTANANNSWNTKIQEGYRPLSEAFARLYNNNGYVYVNTDGTVIINPTSASIWAGFCITYVAAQ